MTTTCLACDDELAMPACWRHAPIGDELMRLHLDQCGAAASMAAIGLGEIEFFLSHRCPYVRLGGPGVKYRCQRYGCTGYHQLAREEK